MAEPGQEPMNKAIIDGQQQPVHNGAGGLVTSGVLPADVVSAPGVTRDSRGKFVAGGAGKSAAVGESDAGGAGTFRFLVIMIFSQGPSVADNFISLLATDRHQGDPGDARCVSTWPSPGPYDLAQSRTNTIPDARALRVRSPLLPPVALVQSRLIHLPSLRYATFAAVDSPASTVCGPPPCEPDILLPSTSSAGALCATSGGGGITMRGHRR
jgi:hypothetical protein